MRDILSKVMTGSMIAGAALLVAACSGGGGEANNTTANGLESEPMYDGGMGNGLDAGMGNATDMGNTMGGEMGNSAMNSAVANDMTTNDPDTNLANGM